MRFVHVRCSFEWLCWLGDQAASAGVVLGVFFAGLLPPADFVMEVAAAADWFCVFIWFNLGRHPIEDLSFPAHDGDVAKIWSRVDQTSSPRPDGFPSPRQGRCPG